MLHGVRPFFRASPRLPVAHALPQPGPNPASIQAPAGPPARVPRPEALVPSCVTTPNCATPQSETAISAPMAQQSIVPKPQFLPTSQNYRVCCSSIATAQVSRYREPHLPALLQTREVGLLGPSPLDCSKLDSFDSQTQNTLCPGHRAPRKRHPSPPARPPLPRIAAPRKPSWPASNRHRTALRPNHPNSNPHKPHLPASIRHRGCHRAPRGAHCVARGRRPCASST